MENNAEMNVNDDESLEKINNHHVDVQKDAILKSDTKRKRKRNRPRTKALRSTIREKIEVALSTHKSPIHDILETDNEGHISAPLNAVISALKIDSDEYRKLSFEALISIGNWSSFFAILGDSRETLRMYLKNCEIDHDSNTVYVDNLPHGCDAASLERWASTFGTVVFVHPIFERKMNRDKNDPNEASTSSEYDGCFFQSAFIKFLDIQMTQKFIEFYRNLRKKAASKRRKKLRLKRIQKSSSHEVGKSDAKKKIRRKKRKLKQAKRINENSAQDAGNQREKSVSLDTARTKVSDVRDHEMLFYSTDTTTDEDENYIKRKERKRRRSHGLAGNASSKKCRMGSEGNLERVAGTAMEVDISELETSEESVGKKVDVVITEMGDLQQKSFEGNVLVKETSVVKTRAPDLENSRKEARAAMKKDSRLDILKGNAVDAKCVDAKECIKDKKETESDYEKKSPSNEDRLHLTKAVTDGPPKKLVEDAEVNTSRRLLWRTANGTLKKRKRVHRRKPLDDKLKFRVLHLKRYFHHMQVFTLKSFQKLRAKYLELQKQQLVQLKADLKELKRAGAANIVPDLSRREWKMKRGRSRLIMQAIKFREEEYEDACSRIPEEEDQLATA